VVETKPTAPSLGEDVACGVTHDSVLDVGFVTLKPNLTTRRGDRTMVWQDGKVAMAGAGAGRIVSLRSASNSLAECKGARWRLRHGVVECDWRGRIVSMRMASDEPPGKR